MNFYICKWVKLEDFNFNGILFGGSLLCWIDEEVVIYVIIQLGNQCVVIKYIFEINFVSLVCQGDIIELGIIVIDFGCILLIMICYVCNKIICKSIFIIDKMVFVNFGLDGLLVFYGKIEIIYIKDQFKEDEVLF